MSLRVNIVWRKMKMIKSRYPSQICIFDELLIGYERSYHFITNWFQIVETYSNLSVLLFSFQFDAKYQWSRVEQLDLFKVLARFILINMSDHIIEVPRTVLEFKSYRLLIWIIKYLVSSH